MDNYSREELLELGFSKVGADVVVSRDVRFFAIEGSLGDRVRIDTYSIITGHVVLGDDVHIAPLTFLSATGGRITMKNGSGTGPHVAILTRSDDYTAADLDDGAKVESDITVGTNAIIGSGCKLLPGAHIGDNASLGSNCVISGEVAAGDMVVSRGASTITMGNRL